MSLPEIEAQSPSLDRPASAIRNVPRPVERLPPARRGASREAAGKSRVRHLGRHLRAPMMELFSMSARGERPALEAHRSALENPWDVAEHQCAGKTTSGPSFR